MVQKHVFNNVQKGTSQREVRPVWNNAMRTNHQNFSNSKRKFAPTAVLTKSDLLSISTAGQSFSKTTASVSAARPFNTAVTKPSVNVAKQRTHAFQKSHSPLRRSFCQQTILKNRNLNNKVNTDKVISVNNVQGKSMTSVVGEQVINDVKPTSYWAESMLVVNHTTNGHQFTMLNRHKNWLVHKQTAFANSWLVQDQTVSGKDKSNLLIADSLLKTIWLSMHHIIAMKHWLLQGKRQLGDLRMIFDPNEEDDIWLNQQYWELLRWKLHEYSGVHSLFLDGTSIQINMLVEKKYPLKKAILEKMINLKLEAEEESTMAHEILKFIKSQIEEQNLSKITRSIQLEPTSILTQSALDALCERFHIPDVVHPELTGRNDRILNSPAGKIGVYSRIFDFANYRVPLSQFLVDVLDYFQINLSQLTVIAAAKVSHFEILCRVHGFVPTVEMDLFAFIRQADLIKVKIGEREAREGEEENVDAVNEDDVDAAAAGQSEEGNHVIRLGGIDIVADDEKLKEDHSASGNIRASNGGKSLAAIQYGDYTDSATGPNMRTQKLAQRFVISSDSTHDSNANAADDEVTSIVRSSILDPAILTMAVATTTVVNASAPAPRVGHELGTGQSASTEASTGSFYASQDMDPATLRQIYVPKWHAINDSALDDPEIC
ncbi:hypothetical protein Tco_1352278 [Tanacetum coccineum]